MATMLRASRSMITGKPLALWTGVAGVGCGLIGGYWICTRRRKVSTKEVSGSHGNRWYWFIGGMTCGVGLVGGTLLLTRRFLYPKPETIYHSILPKLKASREVSQLIGHKLEPGIFRAYSHYGGHLKWVGPPYFIKWIPRGLEMMFQVNGDVGSGMVSASVEGGGRAIFGKKEPAYKSLAVDLPTGERVILKGMSDKVVFKGYTRLR